MQLRDFPALPTARWSRVEDFFARAHQTAAQAELPVWQGDIYLELHRGDAHHAERGQEGAPAGRAGADHGRDAGVAGGAPRRRAAARASSISGAWCSRTSSTTSCPAPPSPRSTRTRSASWTTPAAGAGAPADGALGASSRSCPEGDVADALVVVNPVAQPRPVRVTTDGRRAFSTADVIAAARGPVFARAELEPVPGLSVSETASRERASARRPSGRRHGREPGPQGDGARGAGRPRQPALGLSRSTSRATGTPGTSRTTTPGRASSWSRLESIEVVENSADARRGPRGRSASAPPRSRRPTRSRPTACGSTSSPRSTGTTGTACCAR